MPVNLPGPTEVAPWAQTWLPLVLPAEARRYRIADPALAATVAAGGAELVETDPDVEIAPPELLTGSAPVAVVSLDAAQPDTGVRAVRAARRLVAATVVGARVATCRRTLRRLGYRTVRVLRWDEGQAAQLPGRPATGRLRAAERLPQRAVVVGFRSSPPATLLEQAAADAAAAASVPITIERPFMAGVVVVVAGAAVLRVGVGAALRQLEAPRAALELLRHSAPGPGVADRVPWPIVDGRSGICAWTLEERLAGTRPRALEPPLLEECLPFLTDLYGAGDSATGRPAFDVVAAAHGGAEANAVRSLESRLEPLLDGVPRGFVHGDFWCGNLLAANGRLSGVIDWEAAGPGGLPMVDLLHLRLTAEEPHRDDDWGSAIVRRLLPWARAGGDTVSAAYAARIGFEPSPQELEGLVAGYWLGRAGYQLAMYGERHEQPRWFDRNVALVLRNLGH
jgi:phosphotransferase family enzyme